MHHKFTACFIMTLLTIGGSAQAQTMGDALEQAWIRHPLVASSALNRSASLARADLANGLTPGAASLSLSTLNDQIGAKRGKQEWELEVETPLWLPGQRNAAQAEATAIHKELDAQQRALRLQLAGEVREAWWALAQARSQYTLAAARNKAAQNLMSDIERRTRVGELARLDFNLAQVEQLATQSDLDDAHSALQQAEQNYRLLTGTAPPDKLEPEPLIAEAPTAQEHPQILAAAAATQAAQTKLALAQKSQRDAPTLALRLVRDRGDFAEPYADALGLKLTLPLSLGARVRQALDSNHAQVVQAETEYAQAIHRIALAQETSQRLLKTAQSQLTLATQRSALTQDNLALLEKSFALGESDLPTLLRARAAHFDAQAMLHRQQINKHAAVSRVNQSLGVLP